ncbi:MAG: hypothetical protein ACFFAH_06525 [Promethearchaeota archaeon]
MSKKYEKKIQAAKQRKIEHGHEEKKSSIIDVRNIKKQSTKEQKKALNNIKKKMDKSRKIW